MNKTSIEREMWKVSGGSHHDQLFAYSEPRFHPLRAQDEWQEQFKRSWELCRRGIWYVSFKDSKNNNNSRAWLNIHWDSFWVSFGRGEHKSRSGSFLLTRCTVSHLRALMQWPNAPLGQNLNIFEEISLLLWLRQRCWETVWPKDAGAEQFFAVRSSEGQTLISVDPN